MTVAQIIKKLEGFDQGAEVCVGIGGGSYPCRVVTQGTRESIYPERSLSWPRPPPRFFDQNIVFIGA